MSAQRDPISTKGIPALGEEARPFSAVFDHAPMMVTLSRVQDGRCLEANRKFLEVIGYCREEVIGKTAVELGMFGQQELDRLMELLVSRGRLSGVELVFKKKDGSAVVCSCDGIVLETDTGPMLLTFGEDVTERKRAALAHENLHQQLFQAQKMESIGRLAGGVAHDFNNLLAVILGYAELLLEVQSDAPAELREPLLEIHAACERGKSLTQQLLAFSRKQVLEVDRLDLNDLVRRFMKMIGRLIGEDIAVATRLYPEPLEVLVDRTQIEQVLLNLAINARDAMPRGGELKFGTSAVTLDEEAVRGKPGLKPGAYVLLTASDSGCGMTPATLSRIFEPFFTTKDQGRGTGLGLATVFGVVSRHGGHIEAVSQPGAGAEFRVLLPAAPQAEAGDHAPPPSVRAAAQAGETILLVEDDPSVRQVIAKLLRTLRYRVVEASSIGAAIAAFRDHESIHLLLTDVVMPGGSGMELHERLVQYRAGLKVLYLSGYSDSLMTERGFTPEGRRLLQKPFTLGALGRKVREALDS